MEPLPRVPHHIPRPFPLPPLSIHRVKHQLRASRFSPISVGNSFALITGGCPPPQPLYKGRALSFSTAPLPALLFSPHPSTTCTECLLHCFFTTVARPPRCCPISSERPVEFPVRPSFRCATVGEPSWPGAATRLSSGEPPPRPCPRSTVDRHRPWSTNGGPSLSYFPLKKIPRWKIPADFVVSPSPFYELKPQSMKILRRPLVFKIFPKIPLATFQKLQKNPHNFFPSYLLNGHSDFGNSCAKILRTTSSLILCIH
jgi:hypothetical protein